MKRILNVIANWALILVIPALIVWLVVWIVTEERSYQPPKKQGEVWTITDPQGREWKAVRG